VNVRVEIVSDSDDEIVIRCQRRTDRIAYLEAAINKLTTGSDMLLYIGTTEYYISKDEILFFETYDGKVYAHTRDHMYMTPHKLFEIETVMPPFFVRISKSVIANIRLISSLHRELTGNGEITFKDSDKITHFSRGYYRALKDKIEEVRFGL